MNLRTIIPPMRRSSTMSIEADAGGGAGDGGGGGGGADAGAGGAGAGDAWYSGIANEAVRTSPSIQSFKDVPTLAEAYVSLEKRFGIEPSRRLDLPADPNDAPGMRAVYTRLGLPEKPDGYGIDLGAGATDADKAMLGKATEAFHKIGLPAGMAKEVVAFWAEQNDAAAAAQAEGRTARVTDGTAQLKAAFGAAYDQTTKQVDLLLERYGDDDNRAALKGAEGQAMYPGMTKTLAKLATRMAEPGTQGLGGGSDGGGVMTPDQAAAAVRTLEGDPVKGAALRDKNHAQHAAVVAERSRLLVMKEAKPA